MRNDWLRDRIKNLGKTGQGLANTLGVNKARVSEIIGGRRGVKAEEVPIIAQYLEMTDSEVIERLSGRAQGTPTGGAVAQMRMPLRTPRPSSILAEPEPPISLAQGLPVYSSTAGGTDCDFSLGKDVIDHVRRPPGLLNARNAFALYVVGNSMAPRYDEGDLLVIHPDKPPAPGCDVIVLLSSVDEVGNAKVLLGTYRGVTPSHLTIATAQHATAIEVPLSEVKRVMRVLRVGELLGA